MVKCISKIAFSTKRVQQLKSVRSHVFLEILKNETYVFSNTDESVRAKAPIVRDAKVAKGALRHNHTIHIFKQRRMFRNAYLCERQVILVTLQLSCVLGPA